MVGTSLLVDRPPEVIAASTPSSALPSRAATPTVPPLVRTLALAAAVAGIAELLVHRMISPVVSHVPGVPGTNTTAELVRAGGQATMRATAILVPLAVLGLAAALWKSRRALALLLAGAVGSTIVFAVSPISSVGVIAYALAFGAIAVGLGSAALRSRMWDTAALSALAFGFVVGALPYAAEVATAAGLLPGGLRSTALVRTIAEAAVLVGIVLYGAATVRRGALSRTTMWIAATAGLGAAAMLAIQPEHLAILSLWATGVTLSFSPFVYVLAAMCLATVLSEWMLSTEHRHLAAGLTLLAVAGVAPAAIHHNLTAVLGVTILAHTPGPSPEI